MGIFTAAISMPNSNYFDAFYIRCNFLRADPHSIFFTYQRQLLFTGNYVNGAWYLRPIFAIA